jgi:hypothetical protein
LQKSKSGQIVDILQELYNITIALQTFIMMIAVF